MPDISSLSGLKTTEPLDLPMFKTRTASKPFPPAGQYTARTPEAFPLESFGESQAGFMTVDVSPTIVGGEHDGYRIPFTRVSVKTWKNKEGLEESQFGRYLKACGINELVSGNPQEQANIAERTANQLVTITVDWYAKYRPAGFELKGMAKFPLGADGKPSRFVTLDGKDGRPKVLDPITNEPLTIRAFLEVLRFSPAAN